VPVQSLVQKFRVKRKKIHIWNDMYKVKTSKTVKEYVFWNQGITTRNSSPPKPDPHMAQPTSLQDRFYPMRTSLPSCIQLLKADGNNFELKLQFINILLKYHGLESEYDTFSLENLKSCILMMRISQLGDNSVRLCFIPFALKDLAKKWLYSLVVDSITSWNDFVKAFLKKLYPIHKIALIWKNIMQLK